MPVPPPPGGDYGRLVEELARRLAEQARAGQTPTLDFGTGEAARGVRPEDVYARLDELVREQAKLVGLQEQDERRLQALRERAEAARTPAGRERLREESGLRGQLGAARERAAEPMGPPRALFREVEREDREAASARRMAARIAEQEEARAARAAAREERDKQRAEERATPAARQEAQVGALRARVAYAASPEGQESLREQAALTREMRQLRLAAGGGRGGGGGGAAGAALGALVGQGDFSTATRLVRTAESAFRPGHLARLGMEAYSKGVELAGEANPSAAATYEGSRQSVRQALGETPELQRLSRASSAGLQQLAAGIRSRELSGLMAAPVAAIASAITGTAPARQDLNLPVRAESFGGGEDYYFGLQRAVSEAGANTLTAENLRDQLRTAQELNQLVGDLKDNTKVLRRGIAAWRQ